MKNTMEAHGYTEHRIPGKVIYRNASLGRMIILNKLLMKTYVTNLDQSEELPMSLLELLFLPQLQEEHLRRV